MKTLNKFISILLFVFILTLAFGSRANALSWDVVMNDGFGEGAQNRTINTLVVFGDYIYAGVYNENDGAKVFRSIDGENWTQVNEDGFGNPNHKSVILFADSKNLYAGTAGEMGVSGFKLLKTTNGTDWTQIGEDGFGVADNYSINSMAIFNNKLYIAVLYIDFATFNTGVRIYRIDSDSSWAKVNEEGFGDPSNFISYAMSVFDNKLYVGTQNNNGSEIWRTQNGEDWLQVADNGFGEINSRFFSSIFSFHQKIYASMMSHTGLEVWRSETGDEGTWTQVGKDGFGNVNNLWTGTTPVIVNDKIYIGTGNELVDLAKIYISEDGESWLEEDNSSFVDAGDEGTLSGTFFKNRIYFSIMNGDIGARIIRSNEIEPMEIKTDSSNLPEATKGEHYSYQIEYENGTSPFVCTWEGDLPEGMEVTEDCNIQGIPKEASEHNFTIYLTDSGIPFQSDEKEFTLKVNDNKDNAGDEESKITELPETGNKEGIGTKNLCQIVLFPTGLILLIFFLTKKIKQEEN